jgi:hypothetical protein
LKSPFYSNGFGPDQKPDGPVYWQPCLSNNEKKKPKNMPPQIHLFPAIAPAVCTKSINLFSTGK